MGLALRALGHGKKVVVIQFLKGRKDIGEYKIRKRLGPKFKIYQFGRKEFIDLKKPSSYDIKLAEAGLIFAEAELKKKPYLLILDEVNLAAASKLLKIEAVLDLLKKAPAKTTIVLTGRSAPKEFKDMASLVSEIKEVKYSAKTNKWLKH
ncbi:MAG: cob(I)yrinic acid a,c-diamide adenosyltransferase [Candidatus Saganbacteria bacterium]|nr:cob(I)yrinic acid a,c-diamide adenosyltransferase [Candidatus Saganbacteria bacterium]